MTTRSYNDVDEVPSQPAVRSAWDAVKREVLGIVTSSGFAAIFTASAIYHAVTGHPGMVVGSALLGLSEAMFARGAYSRLSRKLSQLPAPKP